MESYAFHFSDGLVVISSGFSFVDAFLNAEFSGRTLDTLAWCGKLRTLGDRVSCKVDKRLANGTVIKTDEPNYLSHLIRFDDGTLAWRPARMLQDEIAS